MLPDFYFWNTYLSQTVALTMSLKEWKDTILQGTERRMWGLQSRPLPIPIPGLLASCGLQPRKSNFPNSLSLPRSLLTLATHLAPNSMLSVTKGMPGLVLGTCVCIKVSACLPLPCIPTAGTGVQATLASSQRLAHLQSILFTKTGQFF